MFYIFHSGEETEISWNTIGNIAEGRKHFGVEMPVMVYRLLEYTIKAELSHRYGKKASKGLLYTIREYLCMLMGVRQESIFERR